MAVDTQKQIVQPPPAGAEDPHDLYSRRLSDRQDDVRHLDEQLDRLGQLRVAVFGVLLVLLWLIFVSRLIDVWWLAIPAAIFLGLIMRSYHVRRKLGRARRAARYYRYGLDRLEDRWQGKGNAGERFLAEKHLYALDLDVFGVGSLFERVCSARTRPGENALADWLRSPTEPEQIRARQHAVAELKPRLNFREDVALLGGEVPPVDFSSLLGWAETAPVLPSRWWRLVFPVLAAMNVAAVLGYFLYGLSSIAILIAFAIGGSVALWLGRRVKHVLEPVEPRGRDLFFLAALLGRLEREEFAAPLLQELHAELLVEGKPPSEQIGALAWMADWLNAMKNQFFLPFGLLLLWRTQMAFAVEAWRRRSGPAVRHWLAAIGRIEALSSLAGYSYENPEDPFPKILAGEVCVDADNLGHPLLPKKQCVCNDVAFISPVRTLIVSGSNMSGKSTLLRTIGINTVLALAGAPVRAARLSLTPLAVVATLRVQDSLLEGRSRFAAEIARIRDLLDKTEESLPVLYLLDELFHGTNSHDRGIGAAALVRRLLDAGAIGLLTTHDLSLTKIADELGERVKNVHFADQFIDGKMHFDYKMRPGIVPHSNALALMRAIGLEV